MNTAISNSCLASYFIGCLLWCLLQSCSPSNADQTLGSCTSNNTLNSQTSKGIQALLASRFSSLEDLKNTLNIEYHGVDEATDSIGDRYSYVVLKHCSHHKIATSILKKGLSQSNITDAANGTFIDRIALILQDPYAGRNRLNLYKVFNLGRRRANVYGYGDVAFYDLALASVKHIIPNAQTFIHPQDSSEKGYLNTFNHITAQAFITACFSEEFADYIADVHERNNLPQLITGKFRPAKESDNVHNSVDNYVDMINNEWGQSLGIHLKKELDIDPTKPWTPSLLCTFLNKIQQHYCYAFGFTMHPFRQQDQLILKYTAKINKVLIEHIIN